MNTTQSQPTYWVAKAIKVYRMWIKHWPRDKNGALAIANDFLSSAKERKEFNALLPTL